MAPRRQQRPTLAAVMTTERTALEITKMEPLGDRVLVKPFGEQSATAGGVLLPSSAAETGRGANFGEVLAIGEDVELAVKKGDKIIYSTDSSAKVEVPDGEIYFLPEKSILATIS